MWKENKGIALCFNTVEQRNLDTKCMFFLRLFSFLLEIQLSEIKDSKSGVLKRSLVGNMNFLRPWTPYNGSSNDDISTHIR